MVVRNDSSVQRTVIYDIVAVVFLISVAFFVRSNGSSVL